MRYRTAGGFRAALEERLRTSAATSEALLQRTRKLVAFERFRAGDSVAHLAKDYGMTREQVQAAFRRETHGVVA